MRFEGVFVLQTLSDGTMVVDLPVDSQYYRGIRVNDRLSSRVCYRVNEIIDNGIIIGVQVPTPTTANRS